MTPEERKRDTGNGLAQSYSENYAAITLAEEELRSIGRLLETFGRHLLHTPGRIIVTDTELRPPVFSIPEKAILPHQILNDNYIRNGIENLQSLLRKHAQLRETMISAGLGNLTNDLSEHGPKV